MTRNRLALLVGALAFASTAFAQTPPVQTPPPTAPPAGQQPPPPLLPTTPKPVPVVPFPPDSKLAFVSMQTVVAESQLGKAGQKTMQTLQDKKAAEMTAKNKQIDTLKKEITSQQGVLSAPALQAKSTELDRLTRELQFAQQDAQAEVDSLNLQLLENFRDKVLPILDAIRNERGLWAIFSVQDSGAAVWHPGLDLSMEVVKRLDAVKK